jgi:DNA adenine methylase
VNSNSSTNALPRPFLKWVGGKRQLLPELLRAVECAGPFYRYYEPFLGGGALFFELARQQQLNGISYLSDISESIIHAYLGVRDDVDKVIKQLKVHKARHCEKYYYEMRSRTPRTSATRAARIIYLNKTCYNGLHRENSKGLFNAPLGSYENPRICDEENLLAVSAALSRTKINACSFTTVEKDAKEGDLIYLDPPYYPISKTASFTSYSRYGFDEDAQCRLADVFKELDKRGVKLILSNSMTEFIRSLYGDFCISTVFAKRSVNSKGDRRGQISEALITNFTMSR